MAVKSGNMTKEELRLKIASRMRDRWMHSMEPYSMAAADVAIELASEMFMVGFLSRDSEGMDVEDAILLAKKNGLNPKKYSL